MRLKIISLSMLFGLALPLTNGAVLSEEALEPIQSSSTHFSTFLEKGKETQVGIIESNLLAYVERHDALTERGKEITRIFQLFVTHGRTTPPAGYEWILEDIQATPDSAARSEQLLDMEQLIELVKSGSLSEEALQQINTSLDQRKQQVLAARLGIIMQRIANLNNFSKMNTAFLAQLSEAFNNDLEKLKQYRDAETISRWTLESPMHTEPAASEETSTPLPLIADVLREYLQFETEIKDGEIEYLTSNNSLLSENRLKLQTLLDEAKALSVPEEDKPLLGALIDSLGKDIVAINGFIQRDASRLTNLNRTQ